MSPQLRDYQSEAIASVASAWANGTQRPAIVLATGLGKTVVFSELSRLMAGRAARRPVILVHRDELVRQSVDKLRACDPSLRIGVIQGRELGIARTDIVVASVQTLVRRLPLIDPCRFDLVIVDEAHHAAADSYVKCLTHFGAFDNSSNSLALGVTATMSRSDDRALGKVWDDVVFERGIQFGVAGGHLVPAEVRTVRLAGLDTDKVRAGIDGDLGAGPLAKAMSAANAGPTVARAYVEFARGADGRPRRGILFAPKIETAEAWAADLAEVGVRTAVVTGATPTERRQEIYADLAAHRIDLVASVMVLTEGFDLPAVEVAVIGRPTKSMALLTQMVGRVLRPSPSTGKQAALVIDVVGAMGSGLARTVELDIPEPKERIAPDEAEVAEREPSLKLPEPFADIPDHEWIATALDGTPIKAAKRRRGYLEPDWMRTYGGTMFLPSTADFPVRIYVRFEAGEMVLYRKPKGCAPEVVDLRDGQNVRDLHPGIKEIPTYLPASDKQIALLRRLGLAKVDAQPAPAVEKVGAFTFLEVAPSGPYVSKTRAIELLEVHFASRELDR